MKRQVGQVALVVLIISAISLTLGLALADRVRTDIKTDTDDEQLQRAFNAAESGIESYLVNPSDDEYVGSDGSLANISSSPVIGNVIDFGEYTARDHYAYFWLASHSGDDIDTSTYYGGGDIGICYNDYTGAFAVYYFRTDGGNYQVIRKVYNLTADSVNDGENLAGSASVCGDEYQYSMTFSELGGGSVVPLLLAIRPIGGGSRFAVAEMDGGILPSQGEIISSTGRSGSASTTVRAYKRWDPSYYMAFMLEGLTAESSITSD